MVKDLRSQVSTLFEGMLLEPPPPEVFARKWNRIPSFNEQQKLIKYRGMNLACMDLFRIALPAAVQIIYVPIEHEPAIRRYWSRQDRLYLDDHDRLIIRGRFKEFNLALPTGFEERTRNQLFGSVGLRTNDLLVNGGVTIELVKRDPEGELVDQYWAQCASFEQTLELIQTSNNLPLIMAVGYLYFVDQEELLNHTRNKGESFPKFLKVYPNYELNRAFYLKFKTMIDAMRSLSQIMSLENMEIKDIMGHIRKL